MTQMVVQALTFFVVFSVTFGILVYGYRIKQRLSRKSTHKMRLLAQQAKDGLKELDLDDEVFNKNIQSIDITLSNSKKYHHDAYLLRQYAALTKHHTTTNITITYHVMRNTMEDEDIPEMINKEHIDFYEAMFDYWMDNHSLLRKDHDSILAYGFTHIEDSNLIISLMRDRGIHSVESLKSGVQQIRETDSPALTNGVL